MICQQVPLSGDAEWPKAADAVIEAEFLDRWGFDIGFATTRTRAYNGEMAGGKTGNLFFEASNRALPTPRGLQAKLPHHCCHRTFYRDDG